LGSGRELGGSIDSIVAEEAEARADESRFLLNRPLGMGMVDGGGIETEPLDQAEEDARSTVAGGSVA